MTLSEKPKMLAGDPEIRADWTATRARLVERFAKVGNGTSIRPPLHCDYGFNIGDDALIGAGSVVTRDVPAGATALGNPVRLRP